MLPEYISITDDISTDLASFLKTRQYGKIGVLVDENTLSLCWPLLEDNFPDFNIIKIPAGEDHKTLETCSMIWGSLTEANFDRKSLLINLGGGVIGDMGGFCAATYKRGIGFIQIPTTLLSQTDASVGGKLGIDFQGLKNHIGLFRAPEHIFIYPEFLKTLPQRELRSGFAEVIKHCLIADKDYWEEISTKDFEQQEWRRHIAHSVVVKNVITEKDPTEAGLRKILNFGHTIGHALESHYLNQPGKRLYHGEAVAAGMVCEAFLSYQKSGLPEKELQAITEYLVKVYGIVPMDENVFSAIERLARQDKKNEEKTINASLLRRIGDCGYNVPITADDIAAALSYYQKQKG